MRRIRKVSHLLLAVGLLAAPAYGHAAELIVSAASSLTNAFSNIGKAFEQTHPDDKVLFNFGASDALLQQIAKGAPADVFAAADQESMGKAAKQELIVADSLSNFVGNALVLAVPAASDLMLASLSDLTKENVQRIAVSKPETVPAGRYAKLALDAQDLWDTLAAKFIYTQNVRQSLDYVNRAEVDAGFVYRTDAMLMSDKVEVAFEIPLEQPILYPIALVKDGKQQASAGEFIAFVQSEAGQKILAQYGFAKP